MMRNSQAYTQFCTVEDKLTLPIDSVSCIKWSKASDYMFGASSWDGTFRVYEVTNKNNAPCLAMMFKLQFECPVTTFEWVDNEPSMVLLGFLDGRVIAANMGSNQEIVLTQGNFPIREIFWVAQEKFVVSFDCNRSIIASTLERGEVGKASLDYTILCVDFKYPAFALGLSHNKILLFELKDLEKGRFVYAESPLGSPANCIELHERRDELLLGSIDGRISKVAIKKNYVNEFEFKSDLLFKGHREGSVGSSNTGYLFPINSIGYCLKSSSSCSITGGSNGKMIIWDIVQKGRCRELEVGVPITCLRWGKVHDMVAFATGYDWSLGVWGVEQVNYSPNIMVYFYGPQDFKIESK